jgi:hypothetical protein
MGVGTRNDLNSIIQLGRRAAQTIREAQTQPRSGMGNRGGPGGGMIATTARQRALGDRGSITKPFTDALASVRAQGPGVRSTGATSFMPGPFSPAKPEPEAPRTWTRRTESSPDQRRRDAGQTRLGYVDDQEAMYHMAQARNQQAQTAQDAPMTAWLESQGFGADHPIGTGQYEDGKYAGFRTQGLMTAAVKGRGGALQDDAAAQAGDVRTMADELERRTGYLARREIAGMGDDIDNMGGENLDKLNISILGRDINLGDQMRRGVEEATFGDYRDQLATWRNLEEGRAEQGREFADQIEGIPLHQWAQLAAGRDYGIDPNVAAGLYDPSMDSKAFKAERDSQYLQQYGAPYSEVQAADAAAAAAEMRAMTDQERAQEEQASAAENQALEMFNQDVFERTGINGADLASSVDLAPEQLLAYLDSGNYAEAKQLVEDSGGDQATLAELAASLQTSDPTLWRILQAEFELPEPEFDY